MSQPPRQLEATRTLKKLMTGYFQDLDAAASDPSRKVAWCSSVGPVELLRGFGFEIYFPENHAAMLGASRLAQDTIPHAVAAGYSPEVCSYLTADIGACLRGVTPLAKAHGVQSLPRPDVLVYSTNQCRDVQDWFTWYARRFCVPCLGVQIPRQLEEVTQEQTRAVATQFEGLSRQLALVTGHALDLDRMREAVELSRRCSGLWAIVLRAGLARPAPLSFFDYAIHMGPAVVLRGTRAAVDYYELLLEEVARRLRDHVAAVEGERFRILWEGLPVWGRIRSLSARLAAVSTCVVASTYCSAWVFEQLDPRNPFESMARAYTELFIARSDAIKERWLARTCREFGVDGVLYHDARTCPNNSNSRYGMPQRLREHLGLPYLILHGDHNDLRLFSEEQARLGIEAFAEQLAQGGSP